MGVLMKDGASSGVFRFVKMEWDGLVIGARISQEIDQAAR
jgi:hypothetical protein